MQQDDRESRAVATLLVADLQHLGLDRPQHGRGGPGLRPCPQARGASRTARHRHRARNARALQEGSPARTHDVPPRRWWCLAGQLGSTTTEAWYQDSSWRSGDDRSAVRLSTRESPPGRWKLRSRRSLSSRGNRRDAGRSRRRIAGGLSAGRRRDAPDAIDREFGLSSRSPTARLTKSRRCLSVRGVATCSRRISSAERMLVSNPEEELKRRFRFAIAGACCVA